MKWYEKLLETTKSYWKIQTDLSKVAMCPHALRWLLIDAFFLLLLVYRCSKRATAAFSHEVFFVSHSHVSCPWIMHVYLFGLTKWVFASTRLYVYAFNVFRLFDTLVFHDECQIEVHCILYWRGMVLDERCDVFRWFFASWHECRTMHAHACVHYVQIVLDIVLFVND